MPYIPSGDSRERAHQYFEEHPGIHVALLGGVALLFGIVSIFLFGKPADRYVTSKWGTLLLAALFLVLCLHRLWQILRDSRDHG